jgi:hypothetical protein
MANVTITQLPAAGAITGTESVPIVQNGVTVQTTTAALAGSPVQTQTFLTLNQEPTLNNSRALSNGTGVGLVDAGAQSTLSITLNAASGSLEAASNGMIAKTASNAVAARTMSSTTTGLSVTNGDGVAGNPTFALTGVALAVAGATGTGALALTSPTTVSTRQILGTSSQIDVTDGNFANSPVIAISADPVLNGNGGLVIPVGTTGQRGTSTNGNIRFNTTTGLFEGYNGAWTAFASGSGVTSVATGTGLTGGPITSTGTISLANTAVVPAAYTRASITVDQQGRLTSAASGPAINLASDVTGTLPIANGGTGATTSAGAAFALKGANTDLTSVALTTGTVSTTPSGSTDIANKSYVDTVAQGLDTKASCVAATTADITLSAPQTIDGVALIAGDRCLVKNQSTTANNGIYLVAAGSWTRALDMDTWAEVPGAYVFIETGTTQADTGWVCTSNAGGTIGVTAITWAQFSGAGSGVSSLNFGTTGLTPASATTGAITVAGTLAVANGGTNITSYAIGDLIYASTTGVLSKLADVATGNALISGGVGVAPSYGKIALTTHVSGVLPVANGGTNASTASITSFNNITGYTAAGATGTTSTNLVFSASPTFTGTLAAAAITASTTLGVTGVSTLTGSVGVGGASAAGIMLNVADPSAAAATVIVGKFVSAAVLSGESTSWVKVEKDANYGGAIGGYLTQGVGGGLLLGTQNGSATPTERMRIASTGLVTITNGAVIQGLTVGLGANAQSNNTVLGGAALSSNVSGTGNIAVGVIALQANTTGANNTSVGSYSLNANLSGSGNTAIGQSALGLSTGSTNLGLGQNAGSSLTTGNNNTIIGSVAGTAGLSDTVIIAAGSAERMRIDSTGLMKVPGGISGGTF